jgi:NADPH-dependent 2,4-dienoyl-CoA reductase/sulfur reductase-like enzyme
VGVYAIGPRAHPARKKDIPVRTIIVGGVAGGMSAATRLRRLDETREIVVFERGPYVSYANCGLPYYVGGVIRDR